jgi:hypothetical protein
MQLKKSKSMNRIYLNDIYYRKNKEIEEYKDIFLETDIGVLGVYSTSLNFEIIEQLQLLNRLKELDIFKAKYGRLYIEEVRRTYDNDIYLLISGKFILVIEYTLNSNFKYSIQEFRIINDIDNLNKIELDDFRELEIIDLPSH